MGNRGVVKDKHVTLPCFLSAEEASGISIIRPEAFTFRPGMISNCSSITHPPRKQKPSNTKPFLSSHFNTIYNHHAPVSSTKPPRFAHSLNQNHIHHLRPFSLYTAHTAPTSRPSFTSWSSTLHRSISHPPQLYGCPSYRGPSPTRNRR